MRELDNFNVFGFMKISRHQIVTTITAVAKGGQAINRSLVEETVIAELTENDLEALMFGAFVQEGKKARVALREVSNGKIDPTTNKAVIKSIEKALEMVRQA